jgi:hypothetical protein
MAVTITVVIKIVCMSRRQKAEQAAYKIRTEASPSFTHLEALKLGFHFNVQSAQNLINIVTRLQKSVATQPCIVMSRMSNHWKGEFVNGNFGIQSFWRGHGKILPKS